MNNKKELQNYFKKGYKVLRSPKLISKIDDNDFKIFKKVYNIKMKKKDLLPNIGKHMIIIRNSVDQKEFLTNDKDAIDIAKEQLAYQLEPVGNKIKFYYLIMGGIKYHYPPNYIHVDNFIKNLDRLIDARIDKGEYPGTFEVVLSLNTLDNSVIQKKVKEIINFFDYLSTIRRIGFLLLYYIVTPIRRSMPLAEISTKEQWMIPPINETEIICKKYIKDKILIACKKLNQSYTEAYPYNKLVMLWSAVENIFSNSSEHLLTNMEKGSINEFVEKLETLKNDQKRLNKFKSLINDRKIFHKENRNDMISKEISALLNDKDKEKIKKKICRSASLRGKFLHELKSDEIAEINELNIFLEKVLLKYIEINT